MELKLCHNCKSPYLADHKACPRCGGEYEWNPDSWANVTCLLLMIFFVAAAVLLPFIMIIVATLFRL